MKLIFHAKPQSKTQRRKETNQIKSKKKPSRIWVREGLLWVDVLADYCLS